MTKQQYPGNTGNRHGKTVVSFLLWTGHHSIGLHLTGAASGRPTVSGMLATARLLGQTTGAALVAMLFHLATDDSAHIALLIAAGFAAAGSAVSFYRIRLPLPAGLNRRR